MPVTTNFQIPYPDGTTGLTPLETKFADIANATDAALLAGLAGAPRSANSDSARNAIFPSPVQGNTVNRPDKGWVEMYYALYDPSTNPSGATPAGWYPVTGQMIGGAAVKTTTATSLGVGGWTLMTSSDFSSSLTTALAPKGIASFNGTWTITTAGVYEVDAFALLGGTTPVGHLAIKLNDATATNVGAIAAGSAAFAGSFGAPNASVKYALAAGDVLRMGVYYPSGTCTFGGGAPTELTGRFSVRFLEPRRT